jgi:hypothetical protein
MKHADKRENQDSDVTVERHLAFYGGQRFLGSIIGSDIARRAIVQVHDGDTGILAPWSWPPSKDGKIYDDEVIA